jgi:hypothetical protein
MCLAGDNNHLINNYHLMTTNLQSIDFSNEKKELSHELEKACLR